MRTESKVGARLRGVSSAGRVYNSESNCRELILLDQLHGSAVAVVQRGLCGCLVLQVESWTHCMDNIAEQKKERERVWNQDSSKKRVLNRSLEP